MRNPCFFACARYTCLLYQAENCFQVDPFVEPDVLNTSESSRDRLCRSAAKCGTHCELLSTDTSPRVIASQIPSARVINILYITYYKKSGSGASVTVHGMSGTEGQEPGGTDPIDLQLPRGATGSGREQSTLQSTALVTRLIDAKSLLQVTPYHGDKASFLGWKWSFLIGVRAISKPLYEGLKRIEDNMNQDFRKSRLSNEDVELSDQAYTLLALLCKDEPCACVSHTTLERVVARRAKGKCTKGLGFQPKRGEQRKFGGYCKWCWRIGHKEAQCWFKQEYMKSNPSHDPLQRDIR